MENMSQHQRERIRRLSFVAWTCALGLVTMLSLDEAVGDPLVHRDADLLDVLTRIFEGATGISEPQSARNRVKIPKSWIVESDGGNEWRPLTPGCALPLITMRLLCG
jgi:hypothetical protein